MQRIALCRSRRELSNAYFLAKFGFDTEENEPCQVCPLSPVQSRRLAPPAAPPPADGRGSVPVSSTTPGLVLRSDLAVRPALRPPHRRFIQTEMPIIRCTISLCASFFRCHQAFSSRTLADSLRVGAQEERFIRQIVV